MSKGKWITGTERQELADDLKREYEQGRSIRAIAEAHGRSYGFVHRVLTEAGVPLRPRGGDVRTRPSDRPAGSR
ncbi:transcriptional regulator [Streptomyces sp. Ru71]|uniref:helix-turn-helix domain-containing protein n=1 Tax=Streptomyces sp. Ru71 TaxID=2080746 RepID=UPI000CDD4FE5|nr:helix-turn-helix domain-containing protein [Streptomyces sp. Ru71]POX55073.1 transcriptional regulator [Streptomyces sp. Ru71]